MERSNYPRFNEVNKGMASYVGDVSGTAAVPVVSVDYITIGNVSRWPSVLGVQEEKNGRRFSRPHAERVGSRGSRVRGRGAVTRKMEPRCHVNMGTPGTHSYIDLGTPISVSMVDVSTLLKCFAMLWLYK